MPCPRPPACTPLSQDEKSGPVSSRGRCRGPGRFPRRAGPILFILSVSLAGAHAAHLNCTSECRDLFSNRLERKTRKIFLERKLGSSRLGPFSPSLPQTPAPGDCGAHAGACSGGPGFWRRGLDLRHSHLNAASPATLRRSPVGS